MKLDEISRDIVVHETPAEAVTDFRRPNVWFCDLDADFPGPSALSSAEMERAMKFKNLLERRRFITHCAFMRRILANFAGADPAVLTFRDGLHGKPRVDLPAGSTGGLLSTLDFNLSQSENILAMAVVFGGEVGIDIEVRSPDVDYMAIAQSHFTYAECARLRALPALEAIPAFYRLWTRLEAMAKAEGRGLALLPPHIGWAAVRWKLRSFELQVCGRDVIGALAWNAPGERSPE